MSNARESSRLFSRYGPRAVVTGATSGIGLAIAEVLAAQGFDLILVARREAELAQIAGRLTAERSINARVLPTDLGEPGAAGRVLESAAGLDVGLLVCAAGFGTSGHFVAGDLAVERDMLAVNCGACMELAWHFGRRFAGQRRGGIVLLSSLVAFQGVPNAAHYAATKAYIQSLAEGLHHELKPAGVEVLASAPGPVRSGFESRADMKMGFAQSPAVVARKTLAALGRRATVRPGVLAKALEWSLKTLPRWGRVRMMSGIMGGMAQGPRA